MAATDGITATVRGLPNLKAALGEIVPKLRRRALRNALAAGARVVRDEARRNAPVLKAPVPYRTRGTVRRAISVRTSKIARRAGDVGVFVNVRPAKKGTRGAKSRTDPYYWRWLEFDHYVGGIGRRRKVLGVRRRFGSRRVPGIGFLRSGANKLAEALQIFIRQIGPQIAKLNGGRGVQL